MPKGQSPPRTPASDTGCSPTQRARTAQPPAQRAQLVNLKRISPRAGRGMPGQFSLHSAVSVSRRHGAGVKKAPATAPPANLKMSLRFLIYDGSFMTIQATVFQVRLAVAGDTGVHGHGRPAGMSPNIARIATDAVLLEELEPLSCPLTAAALFAFQVAAFDVGDVREVDILGLTRVDQPLGLAARRH